MMAVHAVTCSTFFTNK